MILREIRGPLGKRKTDISRNMLSSPKKKMFPFRKSSTNNNSNNNNSSTTSSSSTGGRKTSAKKFQRIAKCVTRTTSLVVLLHVLFLFLYATVYRSRSRHHLHSNIPDLLRPDETFTTSARRLTCKLTFGDRSGRGFSDATNRPFDPMPSGSVMPFSGAFGSVGLERDTNARAKGNGMGGMSSSQGGDGSRVFAPPPPTSYSPPLSLDTGLNATIDTLIFPTLGAMEGISSSTRSSSSNKKKKYRSKKNAAKEGLNVDMKVVYSEGSERSSSGRIGSSNKRKEEEEEEEEEEASSDDDRLSSFLAGAGNTRNYGSIPSVAQYASRVFILTGISAWQTNAVELAEHFLMHYVTKHEIPARHVLCVIQSRSNNVDAELVSQIQDAFLRYGAFTDVYEGDALLYSVAAARFEEKLALAVDEDDWIVAVDLDEHLDTPHDESIARFLARADALGFNLVNGKWIDRVAEDGNLKTVSPTQTLDAQFPRQCYIGPTCDVRRNPTHRIFASDAPSKRLEAKHLIKFSTPKMRAGSATSNEPTPSSFSSSRRRLMRALFATDGATSLSTTQHQQHNHNKRRKVPRALLNVIAHKVSFPVLDVRVLHDFAIDDVISASLPSVHHEKVYPVPLKVQHYQWHDLAHKQMKVAAAGFERCDQLKHGAAKVAKNLARILSSYWRIKFSARKFGKHNFNNRDDLSNENSEHSSNLPANSLLQIVCPGIACGYESRDIRRVAIVTSVWEHVDGVSRTMKRVAEYLRERDDSEVMVVSPDLAKDDYQINQREEDEDEEDEEGEHTDPYSTPVLDPADRERILVTPVPHVAVPGRAEYKMSAPLQTAQKTILDAFDPKVIHVAAPDVLGHSAVEWARKRGACSVCSYHTAFDTYLQYYHAKLLVRPIRQMLSQFYRSCDVVATPSFAAAEHLEKMGVPFSKLGFFPRGVNEKMYNPSMRDRQYRIDKFEIDPSREHETIVILWVARTVREKGLMAFCRTIRELDTRVNDALPPFKVVVAGDGPDLPMVRKELANIKNVVILGHSGGLSLSKTYAGGDIFFFPSRTEVIPNNIIEAMASGLPVVTDNVGVNRAIVDDEKTGILISTTSADPVSSDIKNYADAIESLMTDAVKRRQMGTNARESTFGLTWDRTFRSLRHIYDRCRPGLPYSREDDGDEDKEEEEEEEEEEQNGDEGKDGKKKKKKPYQRDVIVDPSAPKSSLIYRLSKGMHGGFARSREAAANDDKEDEIERLQALQAAGFAGNVVLDGDENNDH